jgi:hypothetical protein
MSGRTADVQSYLLSEFNTPIFIRQSGLYGGGFVHEPEAKFTRIPEKKTQKVHHSVWPLTMDLGLN